MQRNWQVGVDNNHLTIERLSDPQAMARVLPWLLVNLSPEEQASHLQTFATMLQSPTSRADLIVLEAYQAGERCGVAFAQVLAGRTALVWSPYHSGDLALAQQLLQRLHLELMPRQIAVAQALVSPKSEREATIFETAGYLRAGELVYMVAEWEAIAASPDTTVLSFQPAKPTDPRLAEMIEASYRGSLDCPIVDGWRSVADVIEGYLATGTFHPELWQLGYAEDKIVGCLLMSEYPEQQQGEVVYLGLRPEYRGRGWGRLFVRQALCTGRTRGWQQVLLAVDDANDPAYQMYCREGFEDVVRREVFVRRV